MRSFHVFYCFGLSQSTFICLKSTMETSITEKKQININQSHKHLSDFLKDRSQNSFFKSPPKKEKIQNAISSFNSNKSVGPNSISTRILKLLKNDISSI